MSELSNLLRAMEAPSLPKSQDYLRERTEVIWELITAAERLRDSHPAIEDLERLDRALKAFYRRSQPEPPEPREQRIVSCPRCEWYTPTSDIGIGRERYRTHFKQAHAWDLRG